MVPGVREEMAVIINDVYPLFGQDLDACQAILSAAESGFDARLLLFILFILSLWFLLNMTKSPSQTTYEASHYDDYGFDLHRDFCQFLEEARQHGKESKLKSSSVHPEESGKTGPEKEKKGKKSWKSSLTSWWKADKKSKHSEKNTNNFKSKGSGKRHGHSSGPMYRPCISSDGKHWRPSSGPLISLFKATKREENEIPYISLHQQNNSPPAEQNYGPLYVVT
ncbi:hypothetical protein VNO78_24983 [Psophocarpus tetragonolobus]|uniref:Uncharacterized protein n=1 Tax=Psophocarpus tetragonolobus TaxID=3891 RepID=A0AAN9S8Q0_PSOTE